MIIFLDTTLREGKQCQEGKKLLGKELEYIRLASEFGITEIEVKNQFVNEHDARWFQKVRADFPKTNFWVHTIVRNVAGLLEKPEAACISTFIEKSDSKNQISTLLSLFTNGKAHQKNIRIAIERVGELDFKKVKKMLTLFNELECVRRICFSDTTGILEPSDIVSYFRLADETLSQEKEIEFHLHNDRGLAPANALALFSLSTKRKIVLDVSLGGLGERNGILSIGDALAVSALLPSGTIKGIRKERYAALRAFKESLALTFDKEPLGANAFNHMAHSHLARPDSHKNYEAIKPDTYGIKINKLTLTNK